MKKCSIIIPFYGQTEEELVIPLSSINNQIGIDFSTLDVHLVNDGGPEVDVSRFDILSHLEIHYHMIENSGPGLARQYGIDHSEGEYLMFMDSDDMLQFGGALQEFYNVEKYDRKYKMIIAKFIEQYMHADGNFRYKIYSEHNWSAVYGKWFKRDYLESIDLRFHPDLRIFEDTYFVGLACQLCDDIKYVPVAVYTWLYNQQSLVRDKNKFFKQQLHTWCIENRLWFEKIRVWQPQNLKRDFENYLADLYFRYTKWGAVNEKAFWQEYVTTLKNCLDIYEGYTEGLQKQADAKRNQENGKWHGIATDKFKAFIEKGDNYLKENG
jgi:glycosyltransferase involved in cell wall biosynthesis